MNDLGASDMACCLRLIWPGNTRVAPMVGAVAPALIADVSSAHLRLVEREVSAGAPARAILALVRQQHETLLLMLGLACASAP